MMVPLFFLFLSIFFHFPSLNAGEPVEVCFPDGRVERGQALPADGRLRGVEDAVRRVWYVDGLAELKKDIATEDAVVYEIRPPSPAGRRKLPLVVDHLEFGQWTEDLSLPFSCDGMSAERMKEGMEMTETPKGSSPEFSDVLEVKSFSAHVMHMDARTFHWPKVFPSRSFLPSLLMLVPEPATFEDRLNRAKFLRQAGLYEEALTQLDLALDLEGSNLTQVQAETSRIDAARVSSVAMNLRVLQGLAPTPLVSADKVPESLVAWWTAGADPQEVGNLLPEVSHMHPGDLLAALRSLKASGGLEPGRSHRVEWKSASGEDRHFFIYLPSAWKHGALHACWVTLHGQTSTAENHVSQFTDLAEQNGVMVISPEYIYGRRWGYRFSDAEHEAVLGALRIARVRFGADPERTLLVGHSQGGHMSFDLAQAHPNEFTCVAPFIGAPFLTLEQMRHHRSLPIYIVDGEFDGRAPSINRQAIRKLAERGCPGIYVEYKGRAHDSFFEEFPSILIWASALRRAPWPNDVDALFARRGDGAKGWLQLPAGTINNTELRTAKTKLLVDLKGSWKDGKVALKTDSRLRKVELLLFEGAAPEGTLEVRSNGRRVFTGPVDAFSHTDVLLEVARSGDRWTPLRKVLTVELETKKDEKKK